MKLKLGFLCFFLGYSLVMSAQYKDKCVDVNRFNTLFQLDSGTILPASFSFSERVNYSFSVQTSELTLQPKNPATKVVTVCYRVLPFRLNDFNVATGKKTIKVKTAEGDSLSSKIVLPTNAFENNTSPLIAEGQLIRGVNGGSNSSFAPDSYIDVFVEGQLTDSLEISARIFDQNLVYQPEGNSHQLKNFDRVYVELKGPRTSLGLGDLQIRKKSNGLLNYNRSITGGILHIQPNEDLSAELSFGINR